MKILIAGIGNIFFGDDGFGMEVARRLQARKLPADAAVRDFGVRGFDLACCLTEPWDLVILVDAISRGGAPGTVYVLEVNSADADHGFAHVDPHGLNPARAMELAKSMGQITARVLLVGCEPATLGEEEGYLGLSAAVEAAVQTAAERIDSILAACGESKLYLESQSGVRA